GMKTETVNRRGVDVMIAVDTSLSMLSEDMKPNRLAQARSAILGLFDLLEGDRVGLVAYAGTAYVACPLTLDYSAAAMFVDVLDTDLLPVQGTAIAAAIRAATSAFRQGERRYKVLVLLSDGEDHEGDVMAAARDAGAAGITIFTIGVGGPNGEPIPLRNERGDIIGYKEDRNHRKVTSRLGESDLEAIALATGGRYFRSTPDGIELQRVYEEISRMDQRTSSGRMLSVYEERYQIPLLAALILLALEAALSDRRRDAAAPAKREPAKEAA